MWPIPESLCNACCNPLITLGWILHVGRWGRYKNSYFVVMYLHVHICPYIICGQWFEPHSCDRSAHRGSYPRTQAWENMWTSESWIEGFQNGTVLASFGKSSLHASVYMCSRSSLAFDFGQKPSFYLWWNKQLRITNKTVILWVRNSAWLPRRSGPLWTDQVLRQSQQPLV